MFVCVPAASLHVQFDASKGRIVERLVGSRALTHDERSLLQAFDESVFCSPTCHTDEPSSSKVSIVWKRKKEKKNSVDVSEGRVLSHHPCLFFSLSNLVGPEWANDHFCAMIWNEKWVELASIEIQHTNGLGDRHGHVAYLFVTAYGITFSIVACSLSWPSMILPLIL